MDIKTFLANIKTWLPASVAGDLSAFFLFVGVALAAGFVFGRWKLINILINLYIALALTSIVPRAWLAVSPYVEVGIFLLVLALLTMFDERLFDIHITSAGTDFFWRFFVTSIFVAGSVVASVLSLLPKSIALQWVSISFFNLFASPLMLFFWLVAPLLMLFVINIRLR